MTALANALLRAMGAPENTNLPQPKYTIEEGHLRLDVQDASQVYDEHSCTDYYDDDPYYEASIYTAEQDWEERRLAHRAFEHSQKLIPWSTKEGTCDQHRDLMITLLTEKGYTLLAHGWNSTDDGFPYHVSWYKHVRHQSLLFQAPDNAALAFIVKYADHNDEDGARQSLNIAVIGEVTDDNHDLIQGVLSIRGFRGLSGSWGASSTLVGSTDTRWAHSKGFDPHWSELNALPEPADLALAIQEAYLSIKEITPEAPLLSYAYMGNNIDNSYVFPKSDSFDLFWERAGGRDKVKAFAPKASFTKAWIDEQGRKQYY